MTQLVAEQSDVAILGESFRPTDSVRCDSLSHWPPDVCSVAGMNPPSLNAWMIPRRSRL